MNAKMELQPVIPFEPISADHPPHGEQWAAQIKWDGVRMLAYFDGRASRLVNRRLNDKTAQYPEFADVTDYCPAQSVILDGEMIALDQAKPSFFEIMRRDRLKDERKIQSAIHDVPATYMIFDILYLNGEWVTQRTLQERQALLAQWVKPRPNAQLVPNASDASSLLEVMRRHGMEGIVCKDLTSTYAVDGKDKRWQKVKLFRDVVAAAGGFTMRAGLINALLVGLYDAEGRFLYIGHVGTGKLTAADWRRLTEQLRPATIDRKPFANEPERSKEAYWLEPRLTVKVRFMEWTPAGTMRHPSIQAFTDAPARACMFE